MSISEWIRSLWDSQGRQTLSSLKIGEKKTRLSRDEGRQTADGFEITKTVENLQIRLNAKIYEACNAVEWVLWLKNIGKEDTPLLSEIWTADLSVQVEEDEEIVQMGLNGDRCNAENFMPFSFPLTVGSLQRMVPEGGKSSNGEFPYFDLRDRQGGAIVAIGWSGQWLYELQRSKEAFEMRIGLEDACFYLKPNEEVRMPRILLKGFSGDPIRGHNAYRKLILDYYSPKKADGSPLQLPTALCCFDRYTFCFDHWNTEEGQKEYADYAQKLQIPDTVWLDAAWMARGFPNGVGNYGFRKGFPNGLSPVSQYVHRLGLQFLVWFEVERVSRGTDMERDHPQWVLTDPQVKIRPWKIPRQDEDVAPGAVRDVLNIGDPEAREFIFRHLKEFIRNQGIDIYRQDFTINPLSYWRLHDEPNRRGLTEIRHIMGLYWLWDDLREEFPGLMIDNCAGGGRRIDLEICMRSVPLWRSDTGCSPISEQSPSDVWNQNQGSTLAQYLVYHSTASWNADAYEFRSAATNGIACNFDVFNPGFDFEEAVECLKEFKRLKEYWLGDFYPLTAPTQDDTVWSAYQMHCREKECGMLMVFRRAHSETESMAFSLHDIRREARYQLIFSDEERKIKEYVLSGAELQDGYPVSLLKTRSSAAIEYRKI